MRLKASAQGREPTEARITGFSEFVRKILINSDEHQDWQVHHAQSRLRIGWISGGNRGGSRAVVLELARLRSRLTRRLLPREMMDRLNGRAALLSSSIVF
jgi:hypothetical protein